MTARKPFIICLIIGVVTLYAVYLISVLMKTHSVSLIFPIALSFSSVLGLVLNKNWSKYSVLCLCLFISLYWIYAIVTVFSHGFDSGGPLYVVLSLVPGILLILFSVGVSVVVFRYFRRLGKS